MDRCDQTGRLETRRSDRPGLSRQHKPARPGRATAHEVRLAQTLEAATGGPVAAFEAAAALPPSRRQRKLAEFDIMNQLLAAGETSARLEVLVVGSQLTRERFPVGVDRYRLLT